MDILISGSSGLIGTALRARLAKGGHVVGRLVRSTPDPDADRREVFWNPSEGRIDPAALRGYDAIVHLAGENIASGWWDEATRRRIRDSRVKGTRLLAESLARLPTKPRALVCASATGYYGSRGDEILDERSGPGKGFLADVGRAWEAAADPAREAGVRVVHLRFGMVLSAKGGALPKMLPAFKLGVAGKIGRGDQWMPWVTRQDAVRAILFALEHDELQGPVNVVAPSPVTNEEFTKALGHALSRPTVLFLPAFAAKVLFGPMAEEVLLASCRAVPKRLLEAGFTFDHPGIDAAFQTLLGQSK